MDPVAITMPGARILASSYRESIKGARAPRRWDRESDHLEHLMVPESKDVLHKVWRRQEGTAANPTESLVAEAGAIQQKLNNDCTRLQT